MLHFKSWWQVLVIFLQEEKSKEARKAVVVHLRRLILRYPPWELQGLEEGELSCSYLFLYCLHNGFSLCLFGFFFIYLAVFFIIKTVLHILLEFFSSTCSLQVDKGIDEWGFLYVRKTWIKDDGIKCRNSTWKLMHL